ncbi:uncharacterized protein K452DRAFT_354989 [Aplosporella prunicola CBS 121167]|uniref:F-box domain-containing protein n=1 Tax=Aplosporella prunicola CBS 121167 TaxID=1176127 RepID=A0A6A6BQU7_9PEZI|nr:uncharacterized protein K452DRAFT_354989 [Aplosporella prunicola CBS 121167]KAF2146492.1 hypothetical protein K452DRAFT_354989 [Aplosporella prunicola CBS 121167]
MSESTSNEDAFEVSDDHTLEVPDHHSGHPTADSAVARDSIVTNSNQKAQLNQSASHFLRLPGELRNRIYELLLTSPYIRIREVSERDIRARSPHKLTLTTGLLLVNRQISQESISFIYANNRFMIETDILPYFVGMVGDSITYLTELMFTGLDLCRTFPPNYGRSGDSLYELTQPPLISSLLLGKASSIKWLSFSLSLYDCNIPSANCLAFLIYDYLYYWIKAVGKASGDKFAAMDRYTIWFAGDSDLCEKLSGVWEEERFQTTYRRRLRELIDGCTFPDEPYDGNILWDWTTSFKIAGH